MNEAEKIHTKLLSMLDGEPWMSADNLGRYESTVIVRPDKEEWAVISHRKDGKGMIAVTTMTPFELDRDADWCATYQHSGLHPKLGSKNLCRTEEGLAKLRAFAKRGGEADQWMKAKKEREAAEKEESTRRFWERLQQPQPHQLIAGYTIDECRSGIQHSHPDKGGDPHLFELWKARLEYAKSQEASNQP
jgi:hypothetical protein